MPDGNLLSTAQKQNGENGNEVDNISLPNFTEVFEIPRGNF